ncbi:MAG: ABC transporter permease [Vampirovibrio sp.]|nr:ABC transporter permease [Vampirovibrio sp.]
MAWLRLHPRRGIFPIYQKTLQQETKGIVTEFLATLAIPLSFFLAFGLGLRDYITEVDGVPYVVFMTPGLIVMTMLMEAYRTGAWGLWLDRRHQKMIDEYRIKPITTSDIIIGEILGGFTIGIVKGSLVGLILMLLAPFDLAWQNIPGFLMMVAPGCILFTCVGCMVGTTMKKPDQIAQSQTLIITPLLYLGGLFFPINAFPPELMPLITRLPTTALFDGGRTALLEGVLMPDYLMLLVVAAVASFIAATAWFNHKMAE